MKDTGIGEEDGVKELNNTCTQNRRNSVGEKVFRAMRREGDINER